MSFKLMTALREIITLDHMIQPYEVTHLGREGFRLDKGVWARRWHFDDLTFDNVFLMPEAMRIKGRELRQENKLQETQNSW